MNQYIVDTKYAVENLVRLIKEEENQIETLANKLGLALEKHKVLYADFLSKELDRDENFTEGQYLDSFYRQAMYEEEEVEPIIAEIKNLESAMKNKKHSIDSLSGAVLQIAKQGISIKYNGLQNCPNGRVIKKGVFLKEVIWHGRNQTMHYEENINNRDTLTCLNNLGFLLVNINLSKIIIDLLEWKTYIDYETDMLSLC